MKDGPWARSSSPAVYPSSYNHPDELVKLGRQTDWNTLEGDIVLGIGGKTFLAGDDAVSLLERRELQVVSVT